MEISFLSPEESILDSYRSAESRFAETGPVLDNFDGAAEL